MDPKISIIIVNFNGKKYLKDCLDSLLTNKSPKFEIIIVDNGSTDGSIEELQSYKVTKFQRKKIKIIKNKENLGFAGGNNIGVKQAKGEYLLLLNNDTRVESDFLADFIKAFDEIPNLGCVQPKIVLMKDNDILDSCGSYLTDTTFLYHFGYDKNQKLGIYNNSFPVFSVKGVSMLIKKELVDKIGLFDDDYWCYFEETDFCHRLWLSGYECWYYPKVKIYHAAGGTTLAYFQNSYIQFQNFKNKLITYLKNLEFSTLVSFIPVYLTFNFVLSIFFLITFKPSVALSLAKALTWNIIHIKSTLSKRKTTQLLRKVSDKKIFARVKRNPRLSYYFYQQFGRLKDYKDDPYENKQL